jgi:hypothetical protein
VLGVALSAIDIAVERLTLPAYPVVATLLGVAALVRGDLPALLRAFLGCAALVGYLAHWCRCCSSKTPRPPRVERSDIPSGEGCPNAEFAKFVLTVNSSEH